MTTSLNETLDLRQLAPAVDLATAAALLGIGRSVSYRLVRQDRFPVPVVHVGRLIRVPTAPLLELLGLSRPEVDKVESQAGGRDCLPSAQLPGGPSGRANNFAEKRYGHP